MPQILQIFAGFVCPLFCALRHASLQNFMRRGGNGAPQTMQVRFIGVMGWPSRRCLNSCKYVFLPMRSHVSLQYFFCRPNSGAPQTMQVRLVDFLCSYSARSHSSLQHFLRLGGNGLPHIGQVLGWGACACRRRHSSLQYFARCGGSGLPQTIHMLTAARAAARLDIFAAILHSSLQYFSCRPVNGLPQTMQAGFADFVSAGCCRA